MNNPYGTKMLFPLSQVQRFNAEIGSKGLNGLRYGQAFCNYMHLDRCVQDRDFINTLYYADHSIAVEIINTLTDPNS